MPYLQFENWTVPSAAPLWPLGEVRCLGPTHVCQALLSELDYSFWKGFFIPGWLAPGQHSSPPGLLFQFIAHGNFSILTEQSVRQLPGIN